MSYLWSECSKTIEPEKIKKTKMSECDEFRSIKLEKSSEPTCKGIEKEKGIECKESDSSEMLENNNFRVRSHEELLLREFDLLDEVGPYDDDNYTLVNACDKNENSNNSCDNSYDDYDPSEGDIDALLDERLEEHYRQIKKPKKEKPVESSENQQTNNDKGPYSVRLKTVLVQRVTNHFEVLPDEWVSLTHNSGMPLYLHKPTRVCTLSKPYSLGTASARKHAIPLSAIPCFEYRRFKEEEQSKTNEKEKSALIVNGTEFPSARVETAQENESNRQLTPEQVNEYCKKLFDFQQIEVVKFKSWNARRVYKKNKLRPTLPNDTKLITCPVNVLDSEKGRGSLRQWIMNPNGKSYVCILHEYVQRALKHQPVYQFKEIENTATPYLASVRIENIEYGSGLGSSKKIAKREAAKATLEILIPEIKEKINQDEKLVGHAKQKTNDTDLSFFDDIKVEDPRVTELCAKTTEPLPHEVLLTCLQRNFGLNNVNMKCETVPRKNSMIEFKMTVGNHSATVVCRNKRDGKQRASQAILQALHPHVPSWGSLLRLYGNASIKSVKQKKIEEQEITLLQNRSTAHSPNYAILNKLKEEMKKFRAMKSAVKPIGKFVPPDDIELPMESSSDLRSILI